MEVIETAPTAAEETTAAPDPGIVAEWLLAGHYITLDASGAISAWSARAQETLGWSRKDVLRCSFLETVIAEPDRPLHADRLDALLHGLPGASFAWSADALLADGSRLRLSLAAVPIAIEAGYEFNALLQDIATTSAGERSVEESRRRYESVLALIESALAERDSGRLAGGLVVFDAGDATPMPTASEVLRIAELALGDGSDGDAAAERIAELRAEVASLTGQLDEARREAQRTRGEAEAARQQASDARDALQLAERGGEEARRALERARRETDEAHAAAESARMRAEDAVREADALRRELVEVREHGKAAVARLEAELARARDTSDHAGGELVELRRELGRQGGLLEAARSEAERAREQVAAAAAERSATAHEAAAAQAEVARVRAQLESVRGELDAARADARRLGEQLNAARESGAAAIDPRAVAELRGRFDELERVFEQAAVGTVVTAPDGRIVRVNRALCTMLGYTRERLLGDDPPALVHSDDVDAKRELAHRITRGDQGVARGYRRYVHADGRALTMRETVTLVRDERAEPMLFLFQLEEASADADADHIVVDADVAPDELEGPVGGLAVAVEDPAAPSVDAIRRAIAEERLVLHAQPVVDLATSSVTQYELLLRMCGDDGRLLLPQAFLEPARRAGLAATIDHWVVARALELLAAPATGTATLEVNLSPESIYDRSLPSLIEQHLAATAIDPARLLLEVTGAAAVGDLERTKALAKRLRALGCRFAVDDFRSTFGSFRLLKELPLDCLKLDGELVGTIAESRTSQLIVSAIVDVARALDIRTVGVFVSDDAVIRILRQQGVDCAQGYVAGRPVPVDELWPAARAALPPGA